MFTYNDLLQRATDLYEAEMAANAKETAIYQAKINLARAKDSLEREISRATGRAMGDGKVDGKNAEQRKLQIDACLDADQIVQDWRNTVAILEDRLGEAEASAGAARAEVRFQRNMLDVSMTMVKAELTPVTIVAPGLETLAAADVGMAAKSAAGQAQAEAAQAEGVEW